MKIDTLIHESFANSYAMYWIEPSTETVHTGFGDHGEFAMVNLGYGDAEVEYLLSKIETGNWDDEQEEREWHVWFEQWQAKEVAEGRSGDPNYYRDDCILAALANGWVRAEYEGEGVLDLEADSVKLAQAAAKLILRDDTSAINLSVNGEGGFSVTIPAHRIPHFIKGGKVIVESAIVVDRQLELITEALTPERIEQLKQTPGVFWHGSPSGSMQGAKNGLHVGTFEAARQALNARIGIPAEGYWDGTREYGKTLIAGRKRIEQTERYGLSGYNASPPDEDYYPTQVKYRATYGSDWNGRTEVPFDVWPSILPYRIVGKMTNRPHSPHDDYKANGYMRAAQTKGVAKSGYYYQNKAEDFGSISAVVPNGGAHLEPITEAERRVEDRDVVETALNERAEVIGDLQVQRDPSLQQVIGLLKRSAEQSLRGIVVGGSVYIWDAYDGYHEQVYHALTGVDVKDIFGRPKEYSNFRFVMFTKGTDDTQMGDWTATGPMYEIAPQVYMAGYAGTYTNPTVKSWLRKAKLVNDDPLVENQNVVVPDRSALIEKEVFTLRGWLSPSNEFITVGKYETHSTSVTANPEQFNYLPVEGIRGVIPNMLAKGWVRLDANTAYPVEDSTGYAVSIEAQTLDRAHAGAIYAAKFMVPSYIHADIYDPRGWFSLDDSNSIRKFLRTKQQPKSFRSIAVGYNSNLREHTAPQRPVWYSPSTDTMDPVDAHAPAMARKHWFYVSHMGLPQDPEMDALVRNYNHPDSDEDDEIAMTNRAIALGFVRVYADRDELIVDGRDPDIVRKTVARFARDYPYKKVLAHIHSPEQELQMSPDQCKIYLRTGKVPPARFAENVHLAEITIDDIPIDDNPNDYYNPTHLDASAMQVLGSQGQFTVVRMMGSGRYSEILLHEGRVPKQGPYKFIATLGGEATSFDGPQVPESISDNLMLMVDAAWVKQSYRGKGVVKILYDAVLFLLGWSIHSDFKQTPAGTRIYQYFLANPSRYSVFTRSWDRNGRERYTLINARNKKKQYTKAYAGEDNALIVVAYDPNDHNFAYDDDDIAESEHLMETPLVDYTYEEPEGHWRTLSPSTVALAKSPKAKAKAERMFAKTPFNIKVIFMNAAPKWTHPTNVRSYRGHYAYAGDITKYTDNIWGLPELDTDLKPYVHAFRWATVESNRNEEIGFKKFVQAVLKSVMWDKPGQSWKTYSETGEHIDTSSNEERSRQRLQPGQTLKPSRTDAQLRTQMTRYNNFMAKVTQLKLIWDRLRRYSEYFSPDRGTEASDLEVPEQIKPTTGVITVVINSDDGDDFVPFTPWMIAHRFGHAFGEVGGSYDPLDKVIQEFNSKLHFTIRALPSYREKKPPYIEPVIWGLLAKIGKFKTAREVKFGTTGEFALDCFAQYLIQGRVSFNPVPDEIVPVTATRHEPADSGMDNRYAVTGLGKSELQREVDEMEQNLNSGFERVLKSVVGKVMAI